MNAPADHAEAPPRRGRIRRWGSSAAGVLAALVLCELGLRQISEVAPPYVPVALDTPRDPMHERRVYYEGIARSHFSPAHSRLTGGEWIEGAPVGVIVGDSHVEAAQVGDRATMGAVAERGLRTRGMPVNVRQYGRAGYSAPDMVLEAPEILRRWNPAWVVVVLADNDLDRNAMTGSPRYEIRPDTSFTIRSNPPGPPPTGVRALWRRTYTFMMRSTAFGYMTLVRARRMLAGPRPPQEPLRPGDPGYALRRLVPAVTVRSLRQVYGDRLHILYLPGVGVTPERDQRLFEAPFLDACRAEGVPCTSLYPAMVRARDRDGRLTRGFMNTAPAVAHLNVHGHRLAGEAILRAVGR
jgi:hypothetical protein